MKLIDFCCQFCTKEFVSNRPQAKFCSNECRNNNVRKNSNDKNKPIVQMLKIIYRASGNKMPNGIYTEMAQMYGLSRERIRQIAKSIEIQKVKRIMYPHKCIVCGMTWEDEHLKKRKICSAECRAERARLMVKQNTVEAKCKNCEQTFSYYKHKWQPLRTFCSNRCQGIYLGKTSGMGIRSKQTDYIHHNKLVLIQELLSDAPYQTINGKKIIEKKDLIKFVALKIKKYQPKNKRPTISIETKIKIVTDFKAGMKYTEIMKKYNVTASSIYKFVKESSFFQKKNGINKTLDTQ